MTVECSGINVDVKCFNLMVKVINNNDKPVSGFKCELWFDRGDRFEKEMPSGTCTFSIRSTGTTSDDKTRFWIFVEGVYPHEGKDQHVRVSHFFANGIDKEQTLTFNLCECA